MSTQLPSMNDFFNEDKKKSRKSQGKRLLADYETCKLELNKEIQLLFHTYYEALDKANQALSMFPPFSRSRTLEASIVQSCFAEALLRNFSDKAFYGKYKRLVLRVNGYLILFKKLNKKGHLMNIKTLHVQSILNQSQVLDLFADSDYYDDPILYFGYQKNKVGEYVNPQLTYIDEGKVKFSISEADTQVQLPSFNDKVDSSSEVKPKLKETYVIKKAK